MNKFTLGSIAGPQRKMKPLKDALSGLRQFVAPECPLKLMKSFLFHIKSSFSFQDATKWIFHYFFKDLH